MISPASACRDHIGGETSSPTDVTDDASDVSKESGLYIINDAVALC